MPTAERGRGARLQQRLTELAAALAEPMTLARAHDVPDFIFVYDPKDELILRDCLPGFVQSLGQHRRRAELISLAEIMWAILNGGGWTPRLEEAEPTTGLTAANDTVVQLLSSGTESLEDRVRACLEALDPDRDVAVLHRAGALFPAYRTSALMARLEGLRVPVVLCFPGRSEPPSGLSFMGRTSPDSHYRATILDDDGRPDA